MAIARPDTPETLRTFRAGKREYAYFSLAAAGKARGDVSSLPFSLKVLLENLLRHEDGERVTADDIDALCRWGEHRRGGRDISFMPARILLQDFTGVPAVVDLAAMRDAVARSGKNPDRINPLLPVDLVIDHSVSVDRSGDRNALRHNVALEYSRNAERYAFLRWGQKTFRNFRVVPPGAGICHQVNLERLARVVWTRSGGRGRTLAFPDSVVGTDSHTTMINGLSVLGWGVGGIEAEAAMLGQPLSMSIPEVTGVRISGRLRPGATSTDVVLTVTELLRKKGVVGRFVEFTGPGLSALSLPDRATLANMAPEYGATCGFFPVDNETISFLRLTGRTPSQVALVEAYARKQGLWRGPRTREPVFTDIVELSLDEVVPSIAGPRRPQDRISLDQAAGRFVASLEEQFGVPADAPRVPVRGGEGDLGHGDVVIAAITSCTNTSNPGAMLGAGLLARNAVQAGLRTRPWVKTSLAPGSTVVRSYLERADLLASLEKLGFHIVGYGCTTCIGNSGPLPEAISRTVREEGLVVCSVLSGNRNFEGRIHPDVRANYLASPMLVVAWALAGTMRIDFRTEPLGHVRGQPVWLKDIWPSAGEIRACVHASLRATDFRRQYATLFEGDARWQKVPAGDGVTCAWDDRSTYVRNPPYFSGSGLQGAGCGNGGDITGARCLLLLGDSITTDHISPAGSIRRDSPAGAWLASEGVAPADFNQYGARRGNHEVMMRGTFSNIRLRNEIVPGKEGGITRVFPDGREMSVFDAAMAYRRSGTPLLVIAGREYGSGSSRDWAAKGPALLGVRAVIAESFERIHRSNLIGMGILPLEFAGGATRKSLQLDGSETFAISGLSWGVSPQMPARLQVTRTDGRTHTALLLCRIDTGDEAAYYRHGGILPYVLGRMVS